MAYESQLFPVFENDNFRTSKALREVVMRIAIRLGEQSIADRFITDLRNFGAQFHAHKLDAKITYVGPIIGASAKEPGAWVLSALCNQDKQSVLLMGETQDEVPAEHRREVVAILQRMNERAIEGELMLSDRDHSIMFVVGPHTYSTDQESLWDKILSMETVTQEASSSLEKLMAVSTSQAGAQTRSAKANRFVLRVARA